MQVEEKQLLQNAEAYPVKHILVFKAALTFVNVKAIFPSFVESQAQVISENCGDGFFKVPSFLVIESSNLYEKS